jgi:hypothetical protein
MSLVIPPRTDLQLRESKLAAERLTTSITRGRNPWTKEQQDQLALIYEVVKQTRDALYNIVEANRR